MNGFNINHKLVRGEFYFQKDLVLIFLFGFKPNKEINFYRKGLGGLCKEFRYKEKHRISEIIFSCKRENGKEFSLVRRIEEYSFCL